METIINYLDIPNKEKDKSQKDKLPQYIFMFRDDELVGYSFLIGEKEHICKPFPWWAIDNSDELPLETAAHLLEYASKLSEKCGCHALADRLKTNLEALKLNENQKVAASDFLPDKDAK